MTLSEKNIIEAYSSSLDKLSFSAKVELLKRLVSSLKISYQQKDEDFFNSFGSFGSEKPVEQIITEIKTTRKFRKRT